MAGRFQFENFGPRRRPASDPDPVQGEIEQKLIASYEHGYKAGWDDANHAQAKDNQHIAADFARNLQDMSFTYHEVQAHIIRAVEPLLRDMVSQVLPATAASTLGQTILDALRPMTEDATEAPVELVIHPDSRAVVANLLSAETSLPVTVVEEDTLGAGQVFIRLGSKEKSVDMQEVLAAVGEAIDAYFTAPDRKGGLTDAG